MIDLRRPRTLVLPLALVAGIVAAIAAFGWGMVFIAAFPVAVLAMVGGKALLTFALLAVPAVALGVLFGWGGLVVGTGLAMAGVVWLRTSS